MAGTYPYKRAKMSILIRILVAILPVVGAEVGVPKTTFITMTSPSTSLGLPVTITPAATITAIQRTTLLTTTMTPTNVITSNNASAAPSPSPSVNSTSFTQNAKAFIMGVLPYGNPLYVPDPVPVESAAAGKTAICVRIFQWISILVFIRIGLDIVEDLECHERSKFRIGLYGNVRGNNSNFVYVE